MKMVLACVVAIASSLLLVATPSETTDHLQMLSADTTSKTPSGAVGAPDRSSVRLTGRAEPTEGSDDTLRQSVNITVGAVKSSPGYDPGPYCRPVVGAPDLRRSAWNVGYKLYTFESSGTVELHCNGPIYSGWIKGVYQPGTFPYLAGDGMNVGPVTSCTQSCISWVDHVRPAMSCSTSYEFANQIQIVGSWQQTATSPKMSISAVGPISTGSAPKNLAGYC
jgi:hypothetical protein